MRLDAIGTRWSQRLRRQSALVRLYRLQHWISEAWHSRQASEVCLLFASYAIGSFSSFFAFFPLIALFFRQQL